MADNFISQEENSTEFFTVDELTSACREAGYSLSGLNSASKPTRSGGALPIDENSNQAESVQSEAGENDSLERGKRKKVQERKRIKNKMARMRGESYLGFVTKVNPDTLRKTTPQTEARAERKMGPTCKSLSCSRSKLRCCSEFNETTRNVLFTDFWVNKDWSGKRTYVRSLVDKIPKKISTLKDNIDSKRCDTFVYYLKLEGQRRQVCRQMFMQTLGIRKTQLRGWLKHPGPKSPIARRICNGGDSSYATRFLEEIPKLPSHYCRQSTSKLYLEPMFSSKFQLYTLYKDNCKTENIKHVSWWKFHNLLQSMKIALYQPKKDRCDLCVSFEAGNTAEVDWKAHIQKKDSARAEKERDKSEALAGNCHVLTMDVQKVLMSPMLTASALYYKTKLVVHNFTVFDLNTHHVACYLWDESEGDLVASVFASCLIKYLNAKFTDQLPIVIFSDGCTNQNRNAVMSNALLNYSMSTRKVVYQKYLEKGHTQMEVDSVHSAIERKLKNKTIYLPSDYIQICKDSRRHPQPYDVTYMKHDDFIDYSRSQTVRYSSIRPGNCSGDPQVTDLRQLKYNPNGTIEFKLSHNDNWKSLPRIPKETRNHQFPKLYKNRLIIPQRKYQDLQNLLHVIPEECHEYYKSLPNKH